MYSGDCRDMMRASYRSADHIGAVAVSVHNAGPKPGDERAKQAKLPNIASSPHYYRRDRHAKGSQLIYERVTVRSTGIDDCGDVDRVRSLSHAHHRDYTLESTFPHWSENVKDLGAVLHRGLKLRSKGGPHTETS